MTIDGQPFDRTSQLASKDAEDSTNVSKSADKGLFLDLSGGLDGEEGDDGFFASTPTPALRSSLSRSMSNRVRSTSSVGS